MLIVNAYCRDWGWLFEDLKHELGRTRVDGVTVKTSEYPLPDADAYVALRTNEAIASPAMARTVVQWHDYRSHLCWNRIGDFGALQCVHPTQLEHAPPGARRLEVCRIGYRDDVFTMREHEPKRLTLGWVGRDVVFEGRHIKNPAKFVELANDIRKDKPELKVMMYGPVGGPGGLLDYAVECGAEVWDGDRAEGLNRFYHQLSWLVVTCDPEPGPLTIYEALACGVRVAAIQNTGAADMKSHGDVLPYTQRRWAQFTIDLACEVAVCA